MRPPRWRRSVRNRLEQYPVFVAASTRSYAVLETVADSTIHTSAYRNSGRRKRSPPGCWRSAGVKRKTRPVRGSHAGCSIDRPSPPDDRVVDIDLQVLLHRAEVRSPFAANMSKRRILGIVGDTPHSPSDVIMHFVHPVSPPVEIFSLNAASGRLM